LVAADLLNIRLLEVLGISLAAMGAISAAIFQFAVEGGANVSVEGGPMKNFKGEEYDVVLTVESRATEWIGSMPPAVKIETAELIKTEPLTEGKARLRFLGTYAGRAEDVEVGISLTDPLRLFSRLQHVAYGDFVSDTLPLSLLAPSLPLRLTTFGFGDQPTGYPGPGHELYGLDEYHSGDTKDIIWKRVAKSPDETLTARVREANVKEVVRVGVVQFVERKGEDRAAWIDVLCEALGFIGREVFEMGSAFTVLYHSEPKTRRGASKGAEGAPPTAGLTQARATDVVELAEAVMSCSAASGSRDVERVVSNSDFVITGLRELEDEKMARLISEKPMLLISEEASSSPPSTFADRSMIYTGKENLLPLVRKILER
jgi:uncharacterized protein (DUF58 family)